MKTKIGILGSCVCRDPFRSYYNNYKEEYDLVFHIPRMSFISLFQKPFEYKEEDLDVAKGWENKEYSKTYIKNDLDKTFFKEMEKDIDYLVIDTYFETLFGILKFDNQIITNNFWDFYATKLYNDTEEKTDFNIRNKKEEYFKLWTSYCDIFFKYMYTNYPDVKIILNRVKMVDKVRSKDGTYYIDEDFTSRIKSLGHYIPLFEQYIIDNFEVEVIDELDGVTSDENHIWGKSVVHYTDDYYHRVYKRIGNYIKSQNDTKYKFSIVMAVYNVEKYLDEAIQSIINQSIGFEENVQLILVDDGSSDNSRQIALKYKKLYPENIVLLPKNNGGQARARNLGLKYVNGEYVNFLDSDDYLSENTLEDVFSFFKDHEYEIDLVSIPITLFGRIDGDHRLNYKYDKSRIIDLMEEPNCPQLSSSSAFFKSNVFDRYTFDTSLITSEDAILVNKLLLEKRKYGVINTATYFYRQREDVSSTIDTTLEKKEYYTDRLKNYFMELINCSIERYGEVLEFISYTLAYDFQWIIKRPELDILDYDEIREFFKFLDLVISYITDDAIINNRNILRDYRFFIYFLKKNNKHLSVNEDNELELMIGNEVADTLNLHKIWLDIIEFRNGNLVLSGMLKSLFDTEYINLTVVRESEGRKTIYKTVKLYYNHPSRKNVKYLNTSWHYCLNFNVEIPLSSSVDKFTIELEYDNGDNVVKFNPNMNFNNVCNISTSSIYIVKENHILLYQSKAFHVVPYKYKTLLRYEASCLKKITTDHAPRFMRALFYRIIFISFYHLLRNTRIWLFADRPDFSDDNGKHLYNYATKQEDSIRKYFVIKKDSRDYPVLKKKYPNIVAFGSVKHKILYLFAEKFICSYINEDYTNPFFFDNQKLYKGLFNIQRVFLQHGVTKDDVSLIINKFRKNLYMIATVSEKEKASFMQPGYNFEENVIQCVGFPRYDNLTSNTTKKQVLFMPTWRMQLNNRELFVKSDYYHTLNSFLKNKDLHNFLEDEDYEIIFKPHAELLPYLDLLDTDLIKISEEESYQELFRDSSLLITDYSSVFFDFAYLQKPVIYYQANDDYHYNGGYFDYDNMGFGEVVKSEDKLIDLIKDIVRNDCIMSEKYKNRVLDFFKYDDKNNCKRTYEWLKMH